MILAQINGREYKIKVDHKDFTIQDYIKIRIRLNTAPELLVELYKNYATKKTKGNEEKLTNEAIEIEGKFTKEEKSKTLPTFYGDILGLCSDIPENIMKKIHRQDREKVYNQYCLKTVAELLFEPKSITPINSFKLGKEKLIAPKYYEILGQKRPMGSSQIIEFAEAADLEVFSDELEGGKYEVLPNIISILYRPAGEDYDEKKSLERAKKMQHLTMDIGWSVFFYLKELGAFSLQCIQTSRAQAAIAELRRQLSSQGSTISDGVGR